MDLICPNVITKTARIPQTGNASNSIDTHSTLVTSVQKMYTATPVVHIIKPRCAHAQRGLQ